MRFLIFSCNIWSWITFKRKAKTNISINCRESLAKCIWNQNGGHVQTCIKNTTIAALQKPLPSAMRLRACWWNERKRTTVWREWLQRNPWQLMCLACSDGMQRMGVVKNLWWRTYDGEEPVREDVIEKNLLWGGCRSWFLPSILPLISCRLSSSMLVCIIETLFSDAMMKPPSAMQRWIPSWVPGDLSQSLKDSGWIMSIKCTLRKKKFLENMKRKTNT